MEEHWLSRTELLIGPEALGRLKNAHVMVCGLGGVGSWAAEFVCRAGVGQITIVDHDIVKISNRNRQLPALQSTLGQSKVEVIHKRLMDINPDLTLNCINAFMRDELTPELIERYKPDYIIDAIDTLSPKVFLIHYAVSHGYPIVSSLGAGGRCDPSKVQVADISKSYNCRLAFYMRKRLRKLGIKNGFQVVFSTETVNEDAIIPVDDESNKKSTVGTISFVPPVFGAFCAGVAVNTLIRPS